MSAFAVQARLVAVQQPQPPPPPLHSTAFARDIDARLTQFEKVLAAAAESGQRMEAEVHAQLLELPTRLEKTQQATVLQTLLPPLSSSLEAAVKKAVDTAADSIAAKLQDRLVARLQEVVLPKVNDAIAASLAKMDASVVAVPGAVSAAVSASLGSTVHDAFKAQFASTLLPGYEKASKRMFEEMHSAFKRGIEEFQEPLSAQVQEHCALAASAQSQLLSDTRSELSALLRESESAVSRCVGTAMAEISSRSQAAGPPVASRMAAVAAAAPGPAQARAPPPRPAPGVANGAHGTTDIALTMQLTGLLAEKAYEKAFAVVLGASNLDLLVFLCSKVAAATAAAATLL